jgi:hypothetical protein
MKVTISIDKLALSLPPNRGLEVFYPIKKIPNFRFANYVVKKDEVFEGLEEDKEDDKAIKYRKVIKFQHRETGNPLIIYNHRKKKFRRASPLYVIFYPRPFQPITYPEVFAVERFFWEECGVKLQLSVVHLAVDLIVEEKDKLYRKVTRTLKPGGKRKPSDRYPFSIYFGEPSSSNQLFIYDKGRQLLKVKGIKVLGDMVRIESRFHVPQMKNFPRTIDGLTEMDWSFIYPNYFSFHDLTSKFMLNVNFAHESWRQPIWTLRNIAEEKLGIPSSNFYRSCLVDHPRLSDPVRAALVTYRWCADYHQYQS